LRYFLSIASLKLIYYYPYFHSNLQELGKDIATVATTKTPPKSNKLAKEELRARLQNVPFNANGFDVQTRELESMCEEGAVSLFKSANLRTYPVSLDMLKQRTSLSLESFGFGNSSGEIVTMDDFKYGTLAVVGLSSVLGVASLAFLPPNVGATLCYAFALIPILYLGVGSVAPAAIAQVIDSFKNKDKTERSSENDRVARHEAGHFMCGYMCGLPIVDYTLLDGGIPCVEFSAGGNQRYSNEEVAALSITAMSGLVAEGMEFGDVRGAEQDLLELEQIFRKANDFIGAQAQQDLTRWGALTSYLMLKENKGKLDQLVEAFKEQKDVAECVAILES